MKQIDATQMSEVSGGHPAEYWSCVLYFTAMGTVIGGGNPLAGFATGILGSYVCSQIDS